MQTHQLAPHLRRAAVLVDREHGASAVDVRRDLGYAVALPACGVDRAARIMLADQMDHVAAPGGVDGILRGEQPVHVPRPRDGTFGPGQRRGDLSRVIKIAISRRQLMLQ